jgi:hypothetical protein
MATGLTLAAGSSTTINATIPLPALGVSSGPGGRRLFFGASADPAAIHQEADRQNNVRTAPRLFGPPPMTPFNSPRGAFQSISGMTDTTIPVSFARDGSNFNTRVQLRLGGLPFDLDFLGRRYPAGSGVAICNRGFICLTDSTSRLLPQSVNSLISDPILPNALIAPFWDDSLIGRNEANSGIFERVAGQFPQRLWIIEFHQMEFSTASAGRVSFQVQISESDSAIAFLYREDVAPIGAPLTGISATIGIQDDLGLDSIDATGLGADNDRLPASDITFRAPNPSGAELAITSLSLSPVSGPYLAADLVTLSAGLANFGSSASGTVQLQLMLSLDSFLDDNDILISTTSVDLAAMSSSMTDLTFNIPNAPMSGRRAYFLGLRFDPQGSAADPIRSNNQRALPITVGPAPYRVQTLSRQPFQSISLQPGTKTLLSSSTSDISNTPFAVPGGLPFNFRFLIASSFKEVPFCSRTTAMSLSTTLPISFST